MDATSAHRCVVNKLCAILDKILNYHHHGGVFLVIWELPVGPTPTTETAHICYSKWEREGLHNAIFVCCLDTELTLFCQHTERRVERPGYYCTTLMNQSRSHQFLAINVDQVSLAQECQNAGTSPETSGILGKLCIAYIRN